MKVVCHETLKDLEYYFTLDNTTVFVKDLKHQAPRLLNEAEEKKVKMYKGTARRKTEKQRWLFHLTFGKNAAPCTYGIELSNKCIIRDYALFDKGEETTAEEMQGIAEQIIKYIGENKAPYTGCGIIKNMLPERFAKIPEWFNSVETDYYFMLEEAKKGGANYIATNDLIPFETHIDYHQLYASVMISRDFPCAFSAKVVNGYYEHPHAIYCFSRGYARVKEDGFPILPSLKKDGKTAGADGNWFDVVEELGCLCTPDLELLYKNYEVKGLAVCFTLYYTATFNGNVAFGEAIKEIYGGRINAKNGAEKRFYKLMNQYIAGYFERTVMHSKMFSTTDKKEDAKPKPKNPMIGIFLLAYARKKLDELLTLFPHDKVIGYDTDCVFFAGTPEEVPQVVLERMGENMGQLHFDGIYADVVHKAVKHYYGYDLEEKESFYKCSGMSKSGCQYYWNKEKREYELREVKKDEKR